MGVSGYVLVIGLYFSVCRFCEVCRFGKLLFYGLFVCCIVTCSVRSELNWDSDFVRWMYLLLCLRAFSLPKSTRDLRAADAAVAAKAAVCASYGLRADEYTETGQAGG